MKVFILILALIIELNAADKRSGKGTWKAVAQST